MVLNAFETVAFPLYSRENLLEHVEILQQTPNFTKNRLKAEKSNASTLQEIYEYIDPLYADNILVERKLIAKMLRADKDLLLEI